MLVLVSLVLVVMGMITKLQDPVHRAQDPRQVGTLVVLLVIGIGLSVVYSFNAVLLLRKAKRKTSIILSLISCLGFPFGTILGAISLFVLTRKKIKNEYFHEGIGGRALP